MFRIASMRFYLFSISLAMRSVSDEVDLNSIYCDAGRKYIACDGFTRNCLRKSVL